VNLERTELMSQANSVFDERFECKDAGMPRLNVVNYR